MTRGLDQLLEEAGVDGKITANPTCASTRQAQVKHDCLPRITAPGGLGRLALGLQDRLIPALLNLLLGADVVPVNLVDCHYSVSTPAIMSVMSSKVSSSFCFIGGSRPMWFLVTSCSPVIGLVTRAWTVRISGSISSSS